MESSEEQPTTSLLTSSRHTCRWAAEERMRQQQASDLTRPQSSRARVGRVSENSFERQKEADQIQETFPHGAPKGVLLRSREKHIHSVPAVGFGFVCTAPVRDTRTLR